MADWLMYIQLSKSKIKVVWMKENILVILKFRYLCCTGKRGRRLWLVFVWKCSSPLGFKQLWHLWQHYRRHQLSFYGIGGTPSTNTCQTAGAQESVPVSYFGHYFITHAVLILCLASGCLSPGMCARHGPNRCDMKNGWKSISCY